MGMSATSWDSSRDGFRSFGNGIPKLLSFTASFPFQKASSGLSHKRPKQVSQAEESFLLPLPLGGSQFEVSLREEEKLVKGKLSVQGCGFQARKLSSQGCRLKLQKLSS